jgi:hypothetical protein
VCSGREDGGNDDNDNDGDDRGSKLEKRKAKHKLKADTTLSERNVNKSEWGCTNLSGAAMC